MWMRRLLALLLVAGALLFSLWKCQFGVDLSDEALYTLTGFKLTSPEVFHAPRQFDWLSRVFLKPWLPYRILILRYSAVIFYATALLMLLLLQRKKDLLAFVIFSGLLIYDNFITPTWSHNTWVRFLLMIYAGLILLRPRIAENWRIWIAPVAGAVMALVGVAYSTLWILSLLALAQSYFLKWSMREKKGFLVGLLTVAAVYAIALSRWPYLSDWFFGWKAMMGLGEYQGNGSATKLKDIVLFVIGAPAFWWGLLLLNIRKGFWLWGIAIWAVIKLYFLGRGIFESPEGLYRTYVTVGVACGLTLVFRSQERVVRSLALLALGAIGLMAFSSGVAMGAMFWVLPLIIILSMNEQRHFALTIFWFVFLGAVIFWQKDHTYFDVSPKEATVKLTTPPFEGLYTSPRRAQLVQELSQVVKEYRYAIAYPFVPGIFALEKLQPAESSALGLHTASPATKLELLNRMVKENKIPEIMIEAKDSAWWWGIRPSPWPKEAKRVYEQLKECAGSGQLYSQPEVEVIKMDTAKVKPCVDLLFADLLDKRIG